LEITLAGKTLTLRWGRLGTRGQSKVTQFASDDEARREYDNAVREKRSEGYRLVDGIEENAAPAPVSAHSAGRAPELEAAVIANPEDEAALMVLGDWR
jgi:predicted DNA-binding WGR domain protein